MSIPKKIKLTKEVINCHKQIGKTVIIFFKCDHPFDAISRAHIHLLLRLSHTLISYQTSNLSRTLTTNSSFYCLFFA